MPLSGGAWYNKWPVHSGGDCEFGGNGPAFEMDVTLDVEPTTLVLDLYAVWVETESDWTEATLDYRTTAWTAPSGCTIDSIELELDGGGVRTPSGWTESFSYTDTNHSIDSGHGDMVDYLEINGDTSGDDACGATTDDAYLKTLELADVLTAWVVCD